MEAEDLAGARRSLALSPSVIKNNILCELIGRPHMSLNPFVRLIAGS